MIVAVDPGLMTGIAWYNAGDVGTQQLDVESFYAFVDAWRDDVTQVVCEAYMISPDTLRKTRQLWSLELIGLLRFKCWQLKIPFELQQASSAKKFCSNDLLKQFGFYRPGQDHANDALRHLCIYLVKHGSLE